MWTSLQQKLHFLPPDIGVWDSRKEYYFSCRVVWIFESHLEILASANWHRYWYHYWHSDIKIDCYTIWIAFRVNVVLCTIYSKHVIFSEVPGSSIKGMAVIPRRRFSKVLKRGMLPNPYWRITVVESVFHKTAGIDSRLSILRKRSFHHGAFPADTSEFSAHLQKGLPSILVLVKLVALHCRITNLTLARHNLFTRNILFKTASLRNISRKESVAKSVYIRFAVCMHTVALLAV